MNYRDRIAGLQREAEAKFRNFDGIINGRSFRNAAGGLAPAATETLDANDRTWTFTVVNAATTSKTVVLFGANKDLTDAAKDASVTITVAEADSHVAVKTEILSQPVRILGLKMTAVSATQFSNVLSLWDKKSTGSQIKALFQPLNYRSAQNNLTTQIDAPTFELLVTPSIYIEFTINASETVTLMFTVVEKAQLSSVLRNSPVVAVANRPAPTGLPQIDMPRGV
jgi:hypothetical protein